MKFSTHFRIITFVLILFSGTSISATDLTWTGAIGNNWFNPSNWSPAQVPTTNDDITIGSLVTIAGSKIGRCRTMKVEAGGEFLVGALARLIVIDDNSNYGITLDGGRITNQGKIVIESADGGIISSGVFANSGSIIIKNNSGPGMVSENGSFFQNEGSISIDSVSGYGIDNEGEIENKGSIEIGFIEETFLEGAASLRNKSILTNEACGRIVVNQGFSASSLTSEITNEGWIDIQGGELVVRTSSLFDNTGVIEDVNGPSSTISNINNTGLIYSPITAIIGIGDLVSVSDGTATGLVLSDSLYLEENLTKSAGHYDTSRLLWIVDSQALDQNTFYLKVDNGTCADTITITTQTNVLECTSDNTFLGTTSSSWSDATNWSTASIPLSCENVIINGVALIVDDGTSAVARSITYTGLLDSLTIESGATLTIENGTNGIEMVNANYLINNGILSISNIAEDGLTGGSFNEFQNNGTLRMSSISDSGMDEDTDIDLTNSGTIRLENIDGNGIALAGDFTNTDSIIMESIGGIGIYINGSKDFSSSGYIQIDEASTGGYFEGDFDNSGVFKILNTQGDFGIYLDHISSNSGSIAINGGLVACMYNAFYFSNTGSILLTNIEDYGFYNGSGGSSSAKGTSSKSFSSSSYAFENTGSLVLEGLYDHAIKNNNGIANDTCGVIYCSGTIDNDADLINNGLIVFSGSEFHSFSDTITNYGVVSSSYKTVFELDSNYIDNHGCYFDGPIQDTFTVEVAYISMFEDINDPIVLGKALYVDADLTASAGTYDQSTNSWIPNREAISQDSFYLSYSGLGGDCENTLLITLENTVIAPLCDSLNFNGNVSGFWNTPINWDLQREPDSCDVVNIEPGFSAGLATSDVAYCNLLTIDSTAAFQVPQGAVFTVTNN